MSFPKKNDLGTITEPCEYINYKELEKIEEEKLKSKYPSDMQLRGSSSLFLQKRLRKGSKFFDSGDYQMAQQKSNGNNPTVAITGAAIPTPETVSTRKSYHYLPVQKVSYDAL